MIKFQHQIKPGPTQKADGELKSPNTEHCADFLDQEARNGGVSLDLRAQQALLALANKGSSYTWTTPTQAEGRIDVKPGGLGFVAHMIEPSGEYSSCALDRHGNPFGGERVPVELAAYLLKQAETKKS